MGRSYPVIYKTWIAAVVTCLFPLALRANFREVVVLQNNMALNFDTGAVSGPGGDVTFTPAGLTPQGSAKARVFPSLTWNSYTLFAESYFRQQAGTATSAPISPGALGPGTVFMVVTNSGRIAKAFVLSITRSSIWLDLTTFGATAPAGVPLISEIANNSSGVPLGYSNSGIAPSGLFVIKGSGLSDPGDPVLQSSADPGIPLTLKGTSVSVTVGAVTTHPALYYTSSAQLAAVLPAATPTGNGTITVTYRGQTSPPSPILVVPAALGINTFNGLGVITDVSGSLITYTNPAKPGDIVTLWATGLGADPADSDTVFSSTPHAVNTPLQIYIGGVPATIQYKGSSGFPGVNQINVQIPNTTPPGCWVSLIAVAGSVVSNSVALPVQNGGPCVDVESGLKGSQIAPSGGTNSFRTGLVSLIHMDSLNRNGARTIENTADSAFVRYTGLSYNPPNQVSPGSCILYAPIPSNPGSIAGLDAGAINITGSGGLSVNMTQMLKGVSYALLSATAIPSSGGTFTFRGAGGADIGSFELTMNMAPLLNWTNTAAAANVNQSQDLTLTWTGGNPGSYVIISGASTAAALGTAQSYMCKAPADAGRFTIPSYILKGLPAGTGSTLVQNITFYPLSASGLDISTAIASVGYSAPSTYTAPGGTSQGATK